MKIEIIFHGCVWNHRSVCKEHRTAIQEVALYRAVIAALALLLWQLYPPDRQMADERNCPCCSCQP